MKTYSTAGHNAIGVRSPVNAGDSQVMALEGLLQPPLRPSTLIDVNLIVVEAQCHTSDCEKNILYLFNGSLVVIFIYTKLIISVTF